MNHNKWKLDPFRKSDDLKLYLIARENNNAMDYGYWLQAEVTWMNCYDIYSASYVPFSWSAGGLTDDSNRAGHDAHTHICNIDDEIELLINLKEKAKEYFEKFNADKAAKRAALPEITNQNSSVGHAS